MKPPRVSCRAQVSIDTLYGVDTGSKICSHHSSEPQPVVHIVTSREQDWTEQEVAVESSPTIIYQEVSAGESQSATSTIKALLELQQTMGEGCQE